MTPPKSGQPPATQQKNLLESAFSKLTKEEAREMIMLGAFLGQDEGLGFKLLKRLAR